MQSFETLTNAGQLRRLRLLAVAALAAYDLHEPRLTALMHGDNTTFRVDLASGERYVLRIHRSAYPDAKAISITLPGSNWPASCRSPSWRSSPPLSVSRSCWQ